MLPTKDTLMDTNINKLVLYNLFYSILFSHFITVYY